MKREDYKLVVNGLDFNTSSKVIALTHSRGSVELHMDPRDDADDNSYAVVMTSLGAGRGARRHAAAS